jgi:D-beta-D-heptose 7-phosphate kinase/D-beta-D-heptose 1-phosphate adenosyltransferase
MWMDLAEQVRSWGEPRLLVVGDLMLDRYIWGDAERISQEAPVILLRADRREERLGGASSVAAMVRGLGGQVMLAGIVGDDADGARMRQMLGDIHVNLDSVVTDCERHSTVKERYVGRAQHRHPQQIIRVDYEERRAISDLVCERILRSVTQQLANTDVVLVSDYGKGVCTPHLLQSIIREAKARNIRVIADPIRGRDYRHYRGCSAITPNRLEAGLATGRVLNEMADVWQSAQELQENLDLEAAIITLDKDGMAIHHQDGRAKHFPTRPRQVYDITGAGDMVMSVLGMALASGADYEQSIQIANIAGGLEVEKIGVALVSREEILADLMATSQAVATNSSKIMSLEALSLELDYRRRLGQRIVFTNGCFDVLHAGHVQYLQEARAQGDVLVVGLNSDQSVRMLKGKTRPVQTLSARSLILTELRTVDFVTVFNDATPMHLIEVIRPDVLVKGADYAKDEIVGAKFVESYGGRVHRATLHHGHSTTSIIERMRAA